MESFTSNIKYSINSLMKFIHEGAIIEVENRIEKKTNQDSTKEILADTAGNVQIKDESSDLRVTNHNSCCGHFF